MAAGTISCRGGDRDPRQSRVHPRERRAPTGDLQVRVEVSVCEQRLRQLSQEALQQGGHVVGVEVSGAQVHVGAAVEQLLQGLLPDAVARHPEQALHVQI